MFYMVLDILTWLPSKLQTDDHASASSAAVADINASAPTCQFYVPKNAARRVQAYTDNMGGAYSRSGCRVVKVTISPLIWAGFASHVCPSIYIYIYI